MLKTLGGGSGGGINDENTQKLLDAFETMVENLRKECYAKFADRDDTNQMLKDLS